jgi:hypothetical protein
MQSPCSAQLSFKNGGCSDTVHHPAEVGDNVWSHERPYSGNTMETMKVKLRDRFGAELQRKPIMLGWKNVLLQQAV